MQLKRVLFTGPLWEGSSAVPRMRGLQKIGLNVIPFDSTPWVGNGPKLMRSLNQRFYFGTSVRAMNAKLLRAGAESSPDVVWFDKGNWVYPSTLRRLRKNVHFLIHYNTDDTFAKGAYFWLHRLGLRQYDLYLTTNRWNVQESRQRYGVKVLRVGMGYDSDFYHPATSDSPETASNDVVFVGHWQPHTESYIMALRRNGIDVKVWGHNWWKAKAHELHTCVHLTYSDCETTIRSAKIALCFLSKRNRNDSTIRSFEIPAIGTFMLAERTTEHEFLYGDGVGSALFSNEEELVDKTRYYLDHDKERESIASTGQARCRALGLSWQEHIKREWPIVERILINGELIVLPKDDDPFWKGFRKGEPFSTKA